MYNVQFPGLGWTFKVSPVAFSIGDFSIAWYGVIIAVGFLLAFMYALASSTKFRLDSDKLVNCVIAGMVGGIIGARAYYVIFYPGDTYMNDPSAIFRIRDGGLAIYGGIIGGLLCGTIAAKLSKLKIPAVLDVASLGFLIGQAIGRWGNYVNQEAFGSETTLPWGMLSERTQLVASSPVHPCFFYESMWCALGFVLLHIFSRKFRKYDGQVFLLYLTWYGIGRFFIEGLRTDSLLTPFFDLRVSQLLAGVTILVSVILLIVFRNSTNLDGCGSQKVRALHALAADVPAEMLADHPEADEIASNLDDSETEEEEANAESVDSEGPLPEETSDNTVDSTPEN